MAMVVKTWEEIMTEMTPERMALEAKWLENHVDEYDPENPPLTKEELSRLRHHKDIPPEIEIIARAKADAARIKNEKSQKYSDKDYTPPRVAA